MRVHKVFLAWALACLGLWPLRAAEQSPVLMRLKWSPGHTHKYAVHMRSETTVGGQRLSMQINANLRLQAVSPRRQGSAPPVSSQATSGSDGSISLGAELATVDVLYDQVTATVHGPGRTVHISVDKDDIRATLNGAAMSGSQLEQIRQELRPLQKLCNTRVSLLMTDTGKVVKVSGLQDLDPKFQKMVAADFLQSMSLPEKPLKIGDSFVTKRTLNLGDGGLGGPGAAEDFTIEVRRTLVALQRDPSGRTIARLTAPIKQRLPDAPLGDSGMRASVEVDMNATTLFDVDRGVIAEEKVAGTVTIRPKTTGLASGVPSLITVDARADVTLAGSESSVPDVAAVAQLPEEN